MVAKLSILEKLNELFDLSREGRDFCIYDEDDRTINLFAIKNKNLPPIDKERYRQPKRKLGKLKNEYLILDCFLFSSKPQDTLTLLLGSASYWHRYLSMKLFKIAKGVKMITFMDSHIIDTARRY